MNPTNKVPRRDFLRLGSVLAAGSLVGCASTKQDPDQARAGASSQAPTKAENLEVWRKGKGLPYDIGDLQMPGVCNLPGPYAKTRFPDPDKYKNTTRVHGMCQLCSTVCGITGHIKDGRIIKVDGNPNDPNSRGRLCARGQAALNHQYHPERLLYPIRRIGARGEGKWKRISWDQALGEIATRLRAVRKSGKPEEFALHQGRSRSKDTVAGFLRAFGTNTHLNHRGLCSAARRTANLANVFESDWDLGDYENSRYILNFGSNMFEAHQGHVPGAQRIQRARFEHGAKFVTFDVRMSNTAGNSDEFFMPYPGTDGAVALAMAHTIVKENLADREFFETWTNTTLQETWKALETYTPEWAEKVSTVPAKDIARIAREFAQAAPRATTLCNRGSSAHINGFYNDRAISLLNALVGSVGQVGGWCWMWTGGYDKKRFPTPPQAPKPATPSLLADPPEFVLANAWNTMRVGEIVYWYLAQKRARLQVYLTYNLDSPMTWPEMEVTREVLCDEEAIQFHVSINPFYNETAHFADLVLPWTTYMERWDVDARGAYNLKPYLGIRRPMVEPLGEARDIRAIFPELARRIGGGMEEWYPEELSQEQYMTHWVKNVPFDSERYESPLDFLKSEGAFEDPGEEKYYAPFLRPLTEKDLEGSTTDEKTGIISRDGKGIGIRVNGQAVRGFKTPSRKFEVFSSYVQKMARSEDVSDLIAKANSKGRNRPEEHRQYKYEIQPGPHYMQIEEHQNLKEDEFVMTSFKWNVHNHGRTANLKWCSEIVHSNPAWIHPQAAAQLGLKDGDWIEVVGHRLKAVDEAMPSLNLGQGAINNKLRIPVVITSGVHPKALAISNSLGHFQYSDVAKAKRQGPAGEAVGMNASGLRDDDWQRNLWWEDSSGGDPNKWKRNTGNGWAQNQVLPIAPDFISGQQSFNDTVVRVRKLT
jgi:anaerobic selenocysteine-containing dehydrogenase